MCVKSLTEPENKIHVYGSYEVSVLNILSLVGKLIAN